MVYLTYNDDINGIFRSQVADVARFLQNDTGERIRVVALVSVKKYREQSRKARQLPHRVLVLPMVPWIKNWRKNSWLLWPLFLFWREKILLGRSVFATCLGLMMRERGWLRKVGLDGRAAVAAEWNEYQVGGAGVFSAETLRKIEEQAVLESDGRVAVSHELVHYWKEEYGYEGEGHVVIPCTLETGRSGEQDKTLTREILGFGSEDIVLVYAGSSSGWQSFALMDEWVREAMQKDPRVRWLLLSDVMEQELKSWQEFGDERVRRMWVEPQQVASCLALADHGLLIREQSVTNRVACPTKFAEYLEAGLNVLISRELGDLTAFVQEQGCGKVVTPGAEFQDLSPLSSEQRDKNRELARKHFSKGSFREAYRYLMRFLSEQ